MHTIMLYKMVTYPCACNVMLHHQEDIRTTWPLLLSYVL